MERMNATDIVKTVLVVEPCAEHLPVIEQAFQSSTIPHQLVPLNQGEQALDFLERRGSYSNAPRPDLILLELEFPESNGMDILSEIKQNSQFKRIPVIILTAIEQPQQVLQSYLLQGNSYVVKSGELDCLFQLIRRIDEFWLGIVTLPVE